MTKPSKPLPSQQEIVRVFRYDPNTGRLFWRDSEHVTKRMRGKPALMARASNGYLFGSYKGQYLAQHRVVWKLLNGSDPVEIDHIDGDPTNNRIENLRSVYHAENCRNRKRYSHNTSGVSGVSWNARAGRWYAYIHIEKRMKNLGMFMSKDEAIAARKAAEELLGYTTRENVDA
jgi:hypothetical protein